MRGLLDRALALVDGEHHPGVVRDTLAALPYTVAGAVLLGGEEKLRGRPELGVPLFDDFGLALAQVQPDVVVDLSDEPVLGERSRLALAARALAAGSRYQGADFRFDPPPRTPLDVPTLAVTGSGKRVGKTAVTACIASALAPRRALVVVAMGRGGPSRPTLVEAAPGIDELVEISRLGEHAASDYLEDAAFAGVVTVGCRRCGGGMAGAPFASNVLEGISLAASLEPELVILEGSGTAVPPVEADWTVLVAAADQQPETVCGGLASYRLLVSDLVVLTRCELPFATPRTLARLRTAIERARPGVRLVATTFCPRPVDPVAGRRAAVFTTAPDRAHPLLRQRLQERHGVEVVALSGALARRDQLASDLEWALAANPDLVLVELKAAAIDTVAEVALARGLQVVLLANELEPLPGEPSLEQAVEQLVGEPERLAGATPR